MDNTKARTRVLKYHHAKLFYQKAILTYALRYGLISAGVLGSITLLYKREFISFFVSVFLNFFLNWLFKQKLPPLRYITAEYILRADGLIVEGDKNNKFRENYSFQDLLKVDIDKFYWKGEKFINFNLKFLDGRELRLLSQLERSEYILENIKKFNSNLINPETYYKYLPILINEEHRIKRKYDSKISIEHIKSTLVPSIVFSFLLMWYQGGKFTYPNLASACLFSFVFFYMLFSLPTIFFETKAIRKIYKKVSRHRDINQELLIINQNRMIGSGLSIIGFFALYIFPVNLLSLTFISKGISEIGISNNEFVIVAPLRKCSNCSKGITINPEEIVYVEDSEKSRTLIGYVPAQTRSVASTNETSNVRIYRFKTKGFEEFAPKTIKGKILWKTFHE